jgi:hypothetical protein
VRPQNFFFINPPKRATRYNIPGLRARHLLCVVSPAFYITIRKVPLNHEIPSAFNNFFDFPAKKTCGLSVALLMSSFWLSQNIKTAKTFARAISYEEQVPA